MSGLLALDVGDRYVGIAGVDHAGVLTYRYATIDRKKQDIFLELERIIQIEQIHTIVIGVPYHVEDGSETKQTIKIRDFIASLREKIREDLSYVEIDETLTSREAKESLVREGASVQEEHAEAARLMLEEYLAHRG